MLRRDKGLATWDIAEDFIHGLERCRLCSCCHLLTLQAIIEFLCLLMFAAFFTECCHEILILNFEPILVYLHVYSGLVEKALVTPSLILFNF